MNKAFILDLDGTLLDSMGAWQNVGIKYLIKKGFTNIPPNLPSILKPLTILESANYIKTEWQIDLPQQTIADEINELMAQFYQNEVELKAGVRAFFERHKEHKMCIATATDRHLVKHALKRVGLEDRFEFIITSTEMGNSKRQPDIFIEAAKKLSSKIEDAIVFEDALHAIISATSAGFYTVGVYDESFKHETEQIKKVANEFFYDLSDWRL
ncbi:MAG: HAD family phosphatase [Bacillota bacterium]|nr:HAD family phosphatase [Bacillota bacterium]HHU62128.1 HAD family phosphatase [Natronincola sp.]